MAQTEGGFAVVTGASSGIGRALAVEFAGHGYDLLITAEDAAGLEDARRQLAASGAGVETCVADLATPQGVEQVAAAVGGRPVDLLALNAGIGVGGGDFTQTPLEQELRMIDLNCRSTVHLAKLLIPAMAARGAGRILATSSIAGEMATPYEAVYGATKAFVKSFAAALRYEFKDKGLTVTTLEPGPTETNFFHRAGMDDTKVGASDKADPVQVARQAYAAVIKGDDEVVAGPAATKIEGKVAKLLPESVTAGRHGQLAAPGSAPEE